jgi:DNA modification methylase
MNNQYITGDSRKVKEIVKKKNLPLFHLIISSPPYFDILEYEGTNGQIGFGQKDYESYLTDVAKVFQDCYDLSTENATFWLIIDTFRRKGEVVPLPFDIYRKLKERSKKTWRLKEVIIWDKEKNLPWNSVGKFKNQFEYILLLSKGNNIRFNIDRVREINDLKKWWVTYPERYNPNGKAPSNVWQFTIPIRGWGNGKQNHFCPIPFPLAEKIILIASNINDVVFDPFAGSGSSIALASSMGRKAFGIDISKEYKRRFENEVLQGANDYWNKRENEIEFNKASIQDFKNTNIKLRKLKITSEIIKHINFINTSKLIYFLLDKPNKKFDLIIIKDGDELNTTLENEKIIDLITQSKVIPNILTIDQSEMLDILTRKSYYKYSIEKFYSLYGSIKLRTIFNNTSTRDFIYSDVYLKIRT